MVLLTCDFDINFALMSSLANEFIAACVQQQQQRVCGGGNGAVAVLRPRLSLWANHVRAVTAATDAVTAATDAVADVTAAGS